MVRLVAEGMGLKGSGQIQPSMDLEVARSNTEGEWPGPILTDAHMALVLGLDALLHDL